jgi:Uma2 family endonuclease
MFTEVDQEGHVFKVEEPSPEYSYTYADYLRWHFEERLELFRGKIFRLAAPSRQHQEISGRLYLEIGNYLKKNQCKVFHAPFDVRLPVQNRKKDHEINTIVQPDICVVCDPSKLDERGCCGAPELVIEILSPGNSQKEAMYKFELYREAGVQEYWIVHPAEQTVIIYSLHEGRYMGSKPFVPGETVTSAVLPGLQVPLTDIFQQ